MCILIITGISPDTTSTLTLAYSTAEYCAPIWDRSARFKKVDTELNKTMRIISETLKNGRVQCYQYYQTLYHMT